MTVLYEFAVNVPNPFIIFVATTVFYIGFIVMLSAYSERRHISGTLLFIWIFFFALVAMAIGITRKENYAIAKIETFTDYEKVNTENRVVQLLKDNVFLIEMKSKKNNDETSSN